MSYGRMGDLSCARRALFNRLRRLRCCSDRAVAGILDADIFDHRHLRRYVFVALADFLADLPQFRVALFAVLLALGEILQTRGHVGSLNAIFGRILYEKKVPKRFGEALVIQLYGSSRILIRTYCAKTLVDSMSGTPC